MTEDKISLTLDQFTEIMAKIQAEHRFARAENGRWVKYIRPNFDTRDMKCFYIKLDEKEFSHHDDRPMFETIMEYLNKEA